MINRITSIFNRQSPIEKEMKQIREKLRPLSLKVDLSNNPGWKTIQNMMLKRIMEYEQEIMSLTDQPVKNEKRILVLHIYREVTLEIIDWVCSSTGKLKALQDLLKEREATLNETTDVIRPHMRQPVYANSRRP